MPRSAGEALSEGLLLALRHLRPVLPLAVLSWAPGELVRVLTMVLPLSPSGRLLGSLGSLVLTLLGICLVSAAVVRLLQRPGGACPARVWAHRGATLSGRRLWELLCFGVLGAAWMAPMVAASVTSWVLLTGCGHLLLACAVGIIFRVVGMLQGLAAAVGLVLLYADACAESGLPTRLRHLARWQ
ncbi:MAG: hypothetical protein RMK29_01265 [Myxococcales bacterium]|nr:hypothetical protein [Myxococcota bacterium]MDW8280307.1 hypothetical protein [Myxococcales bacterium]